MSLKTERRHVPAPTGVKGHLLCMRAASETENTVKCHQGSTDLFTRQSHRANGCSVFLKVSNIIFLLTHSCCAQCIPEAVGDSSETPMLLQGNCWWWHHIWATVVLCSCWGPVSAESLYREQEAKGNVQSALLQCSVQGRRRHRAQTSFGRKAWHSLKWVKLEGHWAGNGKQENCLLFGCHWFQAPLEPLSPSHSYHPKFAWGPWGQFLLLRLAVKKAILCVRAQVCSCVAGMVLAKKKNKIGYSCKPSCLLSIAATSVNVPVFKVIKRPFKEPIKGLEISRGSDSRHELGNSGISIACFSRQLITL